MVRLKFRLSFFHNQNGQKNCSTKIIFHVFWVISRLFQKKNWKNLVKISGDGRPEILTKFFSRPKWLKKKFPTKIIFQIFWVISRLFRKKIEKTLSKFRVMVGPKFWLSFFPDQNGQKKCSTKIVFLAFWAISRLFQKKIVKKLSRPKKSWPYTPPTSHIRRATQRHPTKHSTRPTNRQPNSPWYPHTSSAAHPKS